MGGQLKERFSVGNRNPPVRTVNTGKTSRNKAQDTDDRFRVRPMLKLRSRTCIVSRLPKICLQQRCQQIDARTQVIPFEP
jgi:hypothetical protein